MFFELIATVVAGVGAAGLVMALNRLSGGRLPRWLMPAAGGLAMLAFTLWSEYNWYDRTSGALPDGVEVFATVEQSGGWRVWTRAWPYVHRFAAIDRASRRSHPDLPGQHLYNVVLYGRWAPVKQVPVLVDCAGGRRADLSPGTAFGADGMPADPAWRSVGADDPLLAAACEEG